MEALFKFTTIFFSPSSHSILINWLLNTPFPQCVKKSYIQCPKSNAYLQLHVVTSSRLELPPSLFFSLFLFSYDNADSIWLILIYFLFCFILFYFVSCLTLLVFFLILCAFSFFTSLSSAIQVTCVERSTPSMASCSQTDILTFLRRESSCQYGNTEKSLWRVWKNTKLLFLLERQALEKQPRYDLQRTYLEGTAAENM